MKYFANRFTDKLVQWNIVKSEDRELYVYGFWQGAILVCNFATVVIIGTLLQMLWQSLIFLLAPTEDENKPLDETEQQIYKKRSRWITAVLSATAFTLPAGVKIISFNILHYGCSYGFCHHACVGKA